MKTASKICLALTFVSLISTVFADDEKEQKETAPSSVFANDEGEQKETAPSSQSRCSGMMGRKLYKDYGSAMHRQREQSELSPSEWMTTLLFHRILVPLTADEYCSLLDYFTDCDTGLNTEDTAQKIPNSSNSEKGNPDKSSLPCKLGKLPKSNFLLKGTTFASFAAMEDNNNTFLAALNPLFMWRYGTNILYEMELEIALDSGETHIGMEYGNLNYLLSDYLTIRGGKFLLPLGFWKEKMHPEWINKLPTPPLPYANEDRTVIPPSDLGLDLRGAVSVGTCGGRLDVPMVLVYDFWVANGPDEVDGDILLNGTNYNDNNNNKSLGARLSFRPWPYREFGISGMRAQWNNNSHGGDVTSSQKLYYTAIVADTDLHFGDYFRVCGEFMWTKKDMPQDDTNPNQGDVTTRAFWAQASSTCLEQTNVKYIENLEMVVRYGLINATGQQRNQRQWSFGLNYYLTNKMLFKAGYDLNWGDDNKNDLFSIQWAYGY